MAANSGKKTSGKKRLTKEERARKKRNRIILISIEVFVLCLMLIALYVVVLYGKINHETINEDQIVINDGLMEETQEGTDEGLNVDKNDITQNAGLGGHMSGYRNIALFGVDARDKSLGKGNRTDTIIVASINEETKVVKLVSVYRDTYLNLGNDTYNKANGAYAKGGPLQAINMLNMNLDLNITDYITVGWAGVADTIDALGGVDIEVDSAELPHLNNYQVETSKSLGKSYKRVTTTGMQTLDGIQAVSYCRIRYTAGDDYKRAERQREVIQALADKAQAVALKNPATLNDIANDVFPSTATSLTLNEILSLLSDIGSYKIVDTTGFPNEQYRATGVVGGKGDCVIPSDLSTNVTLLHEFLFGDTGYVPSSEVQNYSAKIHSDTGK